MTVDTREMALLASQEAFAALQEARRYPDRDDAWQRYNDALERATDAMQREAWDAQERGRAQYVYARERLY